MMKMVNLPSENGKAYKNNNFSFSFLMENINKNKEELKKEIQDIVEDVCFIFYNCSIINN